MHVMQAAKFKFKHCSGVKLMKIGSTANICVITSETGRKFKHAKCKLCLTLIYNLQDTKIRKPELLKQAAVMKIVSHDFRESFQAT
jgi:hypothetical protein